LNIDVLMSRGLGKLVFMCNGQKLKFDPNALLNNSVGAFDELSSPLVYGKSAATGLSLPQGDFRDINTYYSIQNTFPAIFAVGTDAMAPNASSLQVAQSRQLKGYLTLFDQVLANQFSQLANIDRLFSFATAMVGAPSDLEAFMATKSEFEKEHLKYPAPYMVFSPTYFYQSLYNVPDIKPLLKNNDTFRYSGYHQGIDVDETSWTEYKNDPYNSYMLGLMGLVTDPSIDYERRNRLLDHLLARHGESPVVIDALINGSVYSGDDLQDKVIFKSLYLQNLGLLSYYRQKAYNYLGADTLLVKDAVGYTNDEAIKLFDGNTIDFIFDSDKINEIQRLTENDFINYSALELKLNLLFGLRQVYLSYLSDLAVKSGGLRLDFFQRLAALREGISIDETIKPAVWLLERRKGFIMIETALFWDCLDFNIVVTANPHTGRQWFAAGLDHSTTVRVRSLLLNASAGMLDEIIRRQQIDLDHMVIPLQPYTLAVKAPHYVSTGDTGYYVMVTIAGIDESNALAVDEMMNNGVELFFPDFIPQFITPEFDERLHFFMECSLPLPVQFNYHLLSWQQLDELIPLFVLWHESLRYKENYMAKLGDEEDLAGFAAGGKAKQQMAAQKEHERQKLQEQNKITCTKNLLKKLISLYKIKK